MPEVPAEVQAEIEAEVRAEISADALAVGAPTGAELEAEAQAILALCPEIDSNPLEWSDEEAVEWATQTALNYAESQGIPLTYERAQEIVTQRITEEISAELGVELSEVPTSLEDAEAIAASYVEQQTGIDIRELSLDEEQIRDFAITAAAYAVQAYTGIDFRIAQVSFEALQDGELTQNEIEAICTTTGAIVGAAVGQAFGVPFPVGAMIGGWAAGLIAEAITTGFGIGKSRAERHAEMRAEQMAQLEAWHAEALEAYAELQDDYYREYENTILQLADSWNTVETQLNIEVPTLMWFSSPPPEGLTATSPGVGKTDPECNYQCQYGCALRMGCSYPSYDFDWPTLLDNLKVMQAQIEALAPIARGMEQWSEQVSTMRAQFANVSIMGEPIRQPLKTIGDLDRHRNHRWGQIANALEGRVRPGAKWVAPVDRPEPYLPEPSRIMITDGPARQRWINDINNRFRYDGLRFYALAAARTKVLGDIVQTLAVRASTQEIENPGSVTPPAKAKKLPAMLLIGGGVAVAGLAYAKLR